MHQSCTTEGLTRFCRSKDPSAQVISVVRVQGIFQIFAKHVVIVHFELFNAGQAQARFKRLRHIDQEMDLRSFWNECVVWV